MPRQRHQNPNIKKTTGKNAKWYIRPYVDVISPDGKLTRETKRVYLGPVSKEFGKRQAEAKRNEIMATINRADYVVQSQIPFGALVDIYKKQHVLRKDGERYLMSASTQGKYLSHIENHIVPAFGDLMVCEIETRLVESWLDEKSGPRIVCRGEKEKTVPGLSWATRTDLRNILSSIFTKAVDWGYWQDRNPIERVTVGRKRPVREKRMLTDEQIRQLLAAPI